MQTESVGRLSGCVCPDLQFALNPTLAYRQGSMTATSDVKSRLLFFFMSTYPQARQGGLSLRPSPPDPRPSSPPGYSVTHTGTQPEGPHRCLSPVPQYT